MSTIRFKGKLPIFLSIAFLCITAIGLSFYFKSWSNQTLTIEEPMVTKIESTNTKVNLQSIVHEAQKNVMQIETVTETGERIGSGFLYNELGDIITNAHVVKDASSIYVKTSNAEVYTAALVGIGDNTDIAVIRVPQLSNRTPAKISTSYQAEIGKNIIAVGSPLGFQNSVSLGIISGTNRTFEIDGFQYENVYQISADITNGNSGGPLIDRETGTVVAINSAGSNEGNIGFSIPLNTVMEKIEQWSKNANEQDLNYDSLAQEAQSVDADQMKEDASYIIGYFFDSLSIRDFINAYTLLGSELQAEISYPNFREQFMYMKETTVKETETNFDPDNNRAVVSSTVVHETKEPDKKLNELTINYRFRIGYENDQLKIISMEKEILETETLQAS
ncbi:S1C family serine protease [Radiobacillus kanasensis]|uniref:S1C family serine protease n=1 Tax=Radiobacillus kanasensis TaxID=2844358 RepID=UPI001E473F25|nr:trypsin-like peptidase domain-containing protein [Radiobacillus kanasensis]UFU00859.1 S1C family serine protease [Radiobacillus kanasensis]